MLRFEFGELGHHLNCALPSALPSTLILNWYTATVSLNVPQTCLGRRGEAVIGPIIARSFPSKPRPLQQAALVALEEKLLSLITNAARFIRFQVFSFKLPCKDAIDALWWERKKTQQFTQINRVEIIHG